jgi:glycosyltransferase involved in cell wall biosynthesis
LPAIDGGCKAMNQTTEMLLSKNHNVKVFAISTYKHPFEQNKIDLTYLRKVNFETVFVDTTINYFNLLKNILKTVPYNVERFFNKAVENKLRKILTETSFDVIIFESLYMAEYLPLFKKYSKSNIFLRCHNIEYKLWIKRAQLEVNIFKKLYANKLAYKLKKYETSSFNNFKNIICITADDEADVKTHAPNSRIITIPFAAEIQNKNAFIQKEKTSFFHIGAMDWQPNIDAVNWVIENIIPSILKSTNDFTFYIAGKNMGKNFLDMQTSQLIVAGEVESASDFIQKHDVLIAPIFSGGGMRVKIVEAMQVGKVVITTSLGAAGIPKFYNNEPCILIAETPNEFCYFIEKCITDFGFRERLSTNSKLAIENVFGYENIASQLDSFIGI